VKRKSSARVEAAQKQVSAAEDFVHAAADRVGPLVHGAADRVGPLAHIAADRINAAADLVTPYAHSAADRIAPLAQTAADRVAPLAQSAVDRVGPMAHHAVERVSPYAHQAVDLVTPYAHQAVDRVSPYAHQAVDRVSPLAHQAAEKVAPYAHSAKQRGAQAAHGAVEALGPKLEEAFDRVSPAVDAARGKMTDDLLPRLSGALGAAAAAPVVVEATKRGKATVAAARGELALPEPKKRKGRWLKRLAVLAAVAGVAAVVVRKFLGNKDADWQAARPTTPYTATKPAEPTPSAWTDVTDTTTEDESLESVADQPEAAATDDPQAGESAHLTAAEANEGGVFEAEPPLENGLPTDVVEPAAQGTDAEEVSTESGEESAEAIAGPADAGELGGDADAAGEVGTLEGAEAEGVGPKYVEEGAYVGSEPPEGFVIKGNERSMKYHTPDSGGYSETSPEVWFSSEEAAQEAGFTKAQG
jgi:cell division septum initiation protein DivIVA